MMIIGYYTVGGAHTHTLAFVAATMNAPARSRQQWAYKLRYHYVAATARSRVCPQLSERLDHQNARSRRRICDRARIICSAVDARQRKTAPQSTIMSDARLSRRHFGRVACCLLVCTRVSAALLHDARPIYGRVRPERKRTHSQDMPVIIEFNGFGRDPWVCVYMCVFVRACNDYTTKR